MIILASQDLDLVRCTSRSGPPTSVKFNLWDKTELDLRTAIYQVLSRDRKLINPLAEFVVKLEAEDDTAIFYNIVQGTGCGTEVGLRSRRNSVNALRGYRNHQEAKVKFESTCGVGGGETGLTWGLSVLKCGHRFRRKI
jgi:hypothetical protein